MRRPPAHATVLVTGLFIGGLIAGSIAGRVAVARAQDPYAKLELFARVLTTIERDYVTEVDTETLLDAAIEGMVEELDAHSRWLRPDQVQMLLDDTEGTTTGIGVEVRPADDGAVVTAVLPNSPASRAGLEEGDVIVAIDGESLADMHHLELDAMLRGQRGNEVVLRVMRDGWTEPRDIRAAHDQVQRELVSVALIDHIVYARVTQFGQGASVELRDGAARVASDVGGLDALDGLILDVRDNPGGLLTEALAVSDLFLDEGVIVSTRRRDVDEEVHEASPGGFDQGLAVVVLINGLSASASEIVAAALQDTGRGTLVGTTTYGKGSVQQLYPHGQTDGTALKLTVGEYFTPSGEPVSPRQGRAPDHIVQWPVPIGPADELRERIAVLQTSSAERDALLSLLDQLPITTSAPPTIPWETAPADRLDNDPQLQAAVDLLTE